MKKINYPTVIAVIVIAVIVLGSISQAARLERYLTVL